MGSISKSQGYTVIDQLWSLWFVCIIDLYRNEQHRLTPYSLRQEFSDDVADRMITYREILMQKNFIYSHPVDWDKRELLLTTTGQKIARSWPAVYARIVAV